VNATESRIISVLKPKHQNHDNNNNTLITAYTTHSLSNELKHDAAIRQ